MNHHLVRRALASLFLCLSILAIGVKTADATHFLGGTLRWERDLTYSSPTHVRYIVTFEANWRRSFPWAIVNANPGQLFDPGSYGLVVTGSGVNTTIALPQTAVAVNATEDWLIGQSVRVIDLPINSFPVTMTFAGGDRLSTLAEGNRDATWILRTVIPNATLEASPSTTMLPRIYLQAGIPSSIPIPTVVAPGAASNIIEFAPLTDSSLRIARPIGSASCTVAGATPNPACVACLSSNAGVCSTGMAISGSTINWLPQVAGLYAVQFKVTSKTSAGVAVASVPLDVIFEVLASCPTCTPPVIAALPSSVNVYPGNTLTLPVSATDATPTQTVSLSHTQLPPGATFTVLGPPSNVINAQLQWTPGIGNLGPHTVCFQATDNTGLNNIGQACTTINVIEDQPPVLVCSAAPPVTASVTTGALVNLQASSYDVEGAAVSVAWSFGSTTFTSNVPANQPSPLAIGAQANFPIGTTLVTVTATEGPRTSSCTITVTVNKIPQSIGFGGGGPISFGGPGLPLTGTATSGLGLLFEVISGPGTIGAGNVLTASGVGAIEIKASQAGDDFYAPATPVFAFVVVNDTTAPVIAAHGNESAEAGAGGTAIVNYTSPTYTDDVSPAGVATCVPAAGSFNFGTTQVTCTASDAAGNTATSTFNVEVGDTTAPSIAAHGPETAEATSAAGAVVNYTSPTATDAVDGAVTVSCSPAAGMFPITTSTVTCTATDAHGNNASSTFAVTVSDTTAPTIAAHGTVNASATSTSGGVATYTAPATLDAVDGAGVASCLPASGSSFPMGNSTVTCTAVDAHGNAATPTTFTVSIVNNAPTFAHGNVTAEATGSGGAPVSFVAMGSDVEDGPIAAVCAPASGATFPIGTTTVNCTVTDNATATGSGAFTVTVQDTTAPVVTYSGNAGTYSVAQTVNITCAATDAVGVTSAPCANVSGPASSFGVGTHTFTASASDAAGNTGSASTTFTVTSSVQALQQLVNSFCDNPGICNALNAKLTAAANANNANARQGQLGAFINQVQAQTGKCLTPAEAAILLQLVQTLY